MMAKIGRHSAEEQREAIIAAALPIFATYGLHGASTERIAAVVGISQPYIFRLFKTKKDLFIAVIEHVVGTMMLTFQTAGATVVPDSSPEAILEVLGQAYKQLMHNRYEFLLMLQAFSAAEDNDVQTLARTVMMNVYAYIRQISGASEEAATQFIAFGMLLTISAAIKLPLTQAWENEDC